MEDINRFGKLLFLRLNYSPRPQSTMDVHNIQLETSKYSYHRRHLHINQQEEASQKYYSLYLNRQNLFEQECGGVNNTIFCTQQYESLFNRIGYYTTGSNMKFAWNAHVFHASLILCGDIFGVNPLSTNQARLHTLTARSFPDRSVATVAECSV